MKDRSWRGVSFFFLANVLFGSGLFAHAFLYNFYLDQLQLGEGVMGAAAAALTAGGLVALVPAGALVDRLGAGRTFLVAATLSVAGQVAGAMLVTPFPIYTAAFVGGAGTATWRVAMGPIMMRLTTPEIRIRAFSWNVALLVGSGAVWTAASSQIPAWIESTFGVGSVAGLRWALIISAAVTAVSVAVFPLVGSERTRPRDESRPPRGASAAGKAFADRLRVLGSSLRVPRALMILVLLVGVWMTAAGLVIPFFNLYFLRTHELTVARIGWIFALSQALAAAVIFGSGLLASRLGPARMLAVWMLLFGPALWILGAAHSLGLAVTIFLVQGLVPPATTPLIDQLLLERAPDNRHGAVSSWRNAATELSGLVGATAGGLILAGGSFRLLFGLAGGVGIAGALALIFALSRSETEV